MKTRCIKKLVLMFIIINISISISGCWNYKEIEHLSVVAGCAIDKSPDGKKYRLCVELYQFPISIKSDEIKSLLVDIEGYTIFDAVRNANKKLENKLYWSNCQIIIISQDIAKKGIMPVIDFFNRNHETRISLEVIISADKTARDILANEGLSDPIKSLELDLALRTNNENLSTTNYIQLYNIINVIADEKSLSLPAVKSASNNGSTTSEICGTAIFKKDKLIGFLNSEDSRMLLFITNKVKGGIYVYKANNSKNLDVTYEIYENHTKMKTMYKNNKVQINIKTKTFVSVNDIESNINIINDKELKKLKHSTEVSLENNIKKLITDVQKK